VADYLGLDRAMVLAEFRRMPGDRRASQTAHKQAPHELIPVRDRVLIRSLVQSMEVREVLLPRLPGFSVVKQCSVWPLVETMHALCEEDPAFTYEFLESRSTEEGKHLLSLAIFADNSTEVFSREQAEHFITMLEAEESTVRYKEVQRQMQAAEKSGNMDEAMRLMQIVADMKRRTRVTPA